MDKRLSIILVALSLMLPAGAAERNFTFGVEWGASAILFSSYNFNVIDDFGSRYFDRGTTALYHANGTVMVNAGFYTGDKFKVTVNSGYIGIADGIRVIPVTLRGSLYPSGRYSNGVFYFVEGGAHLDCRTAGMNGLLGSVGAGYRKSISRNLSLDISANFRASLDHPMVVNPDGGYISAENTRKSNSWYYAPGFTVSLNF